jgi:ectoine hydroxylase-related dioxygenase (phytanoyl-CoA dioxygenase family)
MNLKINGKKCNRSAWRTTETFLHLDQNPLLDPEFCRVQGILNLKDNKLDDGGFQGVPGSHKQFKEWGTKHKSSIPPTSHLVTATSRIAARRLE